MSTVTPQEDSRAASSRARSAVGRSRHDLGTISAGELGPSTIVGSAAFNLFVISAVCVCAIPDGHGKTIKDLGVFAITAVFSIFAYLWLAVILLYTSPNVVEAPHPRDPHQHRYTSDRYS